MANTIRSVLGDEGLRPRAPNDASYTGFTHAITPCHTKRASIADCERFRRCLEQGDSEDYNSPEDGSKTVGSDNDQEAIGSVARYCSPFACLNQEAPNPKRALEPNNGSPSAELVELARAVVEHLSSRRDDCPPDATVHIMLDRAFFGTTRMSISGGDDGLRVYIASDRLGPILKLQGNALAREVSDRLGVPVVISIAECDPLSVEQDDERRICSERLIQYRS